MHGRINGNGIVPRIEVQNNQLGHSTMFQTRMQYGTITNLTKLFTTYFPNLLFNMRSITLIPFIFEYISNLKLSSNLLYPFLFLTRTRFQFVKGLQHHLISINPNHKCKYNNQSTNFKKKELNDRYGCCTERSYRNCYSEKDTETLAWNTDTLYEEEG